MKRSVRWLVSFALSIFTATAVMAEVTISTTSKEVGKEGGAFSVNTGGSGAWTATTTASWITLNRASGDAGVSCIYTVAANFSADTRSETINIAGNMFTVYQTGYDATISPTSGTATYEGGSGTIKVTVDAGVSWTATPNVDWLSVSPTSGTNVGSVTYTVAAHTNATTSRTGTLTVAGKTFRVTQTGTDLLISPSVKVMSNGAGTFTVDVIALYGTTWTATPKASWISVVDSGRGRGDDTIMVAVGANPSAQPRTGTVTIGSKTLTITQAGTMDISIAITPTNAVASPVGAYGNIAVYATPDAQWLATSQDSWITISDGATGAGNGNTKYVVAPNPGLTARTGRILFEVEGGTPGPGPDIEIDLEPDVNAGLLLHIPKSTDNATGTRWTTQSLNSTFDGTYSVTINGAPLPRLAKNDWSFSFQFRVNEANALHRLVTCFGVPIYIDEDDKLHFEGQTTDYTVCAGEWHTVVFCHDAEGVVRLYAGVTNALQIASYTREWLWNFTSDIETDLSGKILFGYASSPSSGYLKGGSFKNFRIWGRALMESEASQVIEGVESREKEPKNIPTTLTCRHFRCNMNGYHSVSSNEWVPASSNGITVTGWSEFVGRSGLRQRAMKSNGEGAIIISDMNQIFPGIYVVNNGKEFPKYAEAAFTQDLGGGAYLRCPYPITSSGSSNATYNFWVYFDSFQNLSTSIFRRVRTCGEEFGAAGQYTNLWCRNNVSFSLVVDACHLPK